SDCRLSRDTATTGVCCRSRTRSRARAHDVRFQADRQRGPAKAGRHVRALATARLKPRAPRTKGASRYSHQRSLALLAPRTRRKGARAFRRALRWRLGSVARSTRESRDRVDLAQRRDLGVAVSRLTQDVVRVLAEERRPA